MNKRFRKTQGKHSSSSVQKFGMARRSVDLTLAEDERDVCRVGFSECRLFKDKSVLMRAAP